MLWDSRTNSAGVAYTSEMGICRVPRVHHETHVVRNIQNLVALDAHAVAIISDAWLLTHS